MSYNNVGKKPLALESIWENWEMNPIIEIRVMDHNCPSDFEPMFDWMWPGSYSGCYKAPNSFNWNKKCHEDE